MARKTLGLRKKKKYQRHNKKQPTRKRKRKGKGFLSRLLSRKKNPKILKVEKYNNNWTPPNDSFLTNLANIEAKKTQPAHITIDHLKNEQKKKFDKIGFFLKD